MQNRATAQVKPNQAMHVQQPRVSSDCTAEVCEACKQLHLRHTFRPNVIHAVIAKQSSGCSSTLLDTASLPRAPATLERGRQPSEALRGHLSRVDRVGIAQLPLSASTSCKMSELTKLIKAYRENVGSAAKHGCKFAMAMTLTGAWQASDAAAAATLKPSSIPSHHDSYVSVMYREDAMCKVCQPAGR